jgi:hypothetical protein
MKKIKLTQNKYTLVDDENYDYLNQFNWYCHSENYAVRTDKFGKAIYMHRIIMNISNKLYIDHINANGLDNRKENLRICNKKQNAGNSKLYKNNTSGIKGVTWHKASKKWRAVITINKKVKNLGYFSDKNNAKLIYEKAAKQHFEEFYSDGIGRKDY